MTTLPVCAADQRYSYASTSCSNSKTLLMTGWISFASKHASMSWSCSRESWITPLNPMASNEACQRQRPADLDDVVRADPSRDPLHLGSPSPASSRS